MDSLIQKSKSICYICGKGMYGRYDTHHIFEGTANRKKADEDLMVCFVHRDCHRWLHNHPKSMLTYKIRAQKVWEDNYGNRDDFIKRYGRSYI